MSGASILIGAVLTFQTTDASELQLTVSLSQSASVSLEWNGVLQEAGPAARRHAFAHLPTPRAAAIEYRLQVRGEPVRTTVVKPLFSGAPLVVGLYGDSRDGNGPHEVIVRAMSEADPHVVVHTGDMVHSARDDQGWLTHLAATLPLTSRVPVILSVGNHELWQSWQIPASERIDAVASAMGQVPPPHDPLALALGVAPTIFHVRIADALFVSLDSNAAIGEGSPQLKFVQRVLEANRDAKYSFLSLHHGPLSSGRHGNLPNGAALLAVAEQFGVTAVLSGHDHIYERLVSARTTFVVSGGGGAPLYQRARQTPGSKAFASTYNWERLDLGPEHVALTAFGLEGTVLDRAVMPPEQAEVREPVRSRGWLLGAMVTLVLGLGWVGFRLLWRTGRVA